MKIAKGGKEELISQSHWQTMRDWGACQSSQGKRLVAFTIWVTAHKPGSLLVTSGSVGWSLRPTQRTYQRPNFQCGEMDSGWIVGELGGCQSTCDFKVSDFANCLEAEVESKRRRRVWGLLSAEIDSSLPRSLSLGDPTLDGISVFLGREQRSRGGGVGFVILFLSFSTNEHQSPLGGKKLVFILPLFSQAESSQIRPIFRKKSFSLFFFL